MSVTIKVDLITYQKIKNFYSPYLIDFKGEYIDFVSFFQETKISGYISKKTYHKVVFSGVNAEKESSRWIKETPIENKTNSWLDIQEQIGSDEVGVGDYFLPIIVVASYVHPKQIKRLKELGVTDSKKINDKKILEIGESLIREFTFSKLTLNNEKYNEQIALGENSHSIKAKMHNRALNNLLNKFPDIYRIYVDQFVNEKKFYSYLDERDLPFVKGIAFKTKGESFFPSVALSSVIARYYLIKEKEKLDEKYHISFPFGAGKKVDEFAHQLLKNIPQNEFDKLVKKNFKNYNR